MTNLPEKIYSEAEVERAGRGLYHDGSQWSVVSLVDSGEGS